MFKIKHTDLPSEQKRIKMAEFINARKGYSIKWLLENVYRLMAMYEKERDDYNLEQDMYRMRTQMVEEQLPLFKQKDGETYILADSGEYTLLN